jgi:hypothetical protein
MTREEVIKLLGDKIFEIRLIQDMDTTKPYIQSNDLAKEILDWLDSIGYYNMHFYGVATPDPSGEKPSISPYGCTCLGPVRNDVAWHHVTCPWRISMLRKET